MVKIYVVYTEIEWEGIQDIEAAYTSEDDAKKHAARLKRGRGEYFHADYVELELATPVTVEPGSEEEHER